MFVRANGSSANLGPGFDVLGMALDIPFEIQVVGHGEPDEELLPMEPSHPAHLAWVEAGGNPGAALRWRSPIPPGRGQGFSGAARVAGAFAALLVDGAVESEARRSAVEVATRLEGHADNAAASGYGGIVVAAADEVVMLPEPEGLSIVLWWPEQRTPTDASRRSLVDPLPRADAVFNLGRACLLVAALSMGEYELLGPATEDRLHQDARLDASPSSRAALELLRPHAVGVWLSGSGPTVAGFVEDDRVDGAVAALEGQPGRTRVTRIGAGVSATYAATS